MTPVALILAAGRGRRLGLGPKALVPWDGSALVVRAVRAALTARLIPVVTAGPERERIAAVLADAGHHSTSVVPVHDAELGMSASFRAGVAAIGSVQDGVPVRGGGVAEGPSPPAGGTIPVVIMLVDQPGVGAAVLTRLCGHFANRSGRVVRAAWSDTPGHPVVMTLAQARQAAELATGDAAGREWMMRHRHLVDPVDCSDIGSGEDIDTPTDLLRWQSRRAQGLVQRHTPPRDPLALQPPESVA